jgi:hypothetical protein
VYQVTLDEIEWSVDNELPPPIEIEEDMALSETDKAWIENAVNTANRPTIPALATPLPASTWWQRYGTIAQLVTMAIALCSGIGLPIYFRHVDYTAKITDDHINQLIDQKLNPAVAAINANTSSQITILDGKVQSLSEKVANLYGLKGKVVDLEEKANRQLSLARLIDPTRTLANVRIEIQQAQSNGQALPPNTITDYRNAALEIPSTTFGYWETVAAIINYQSKINQWNGLAPDPVKVAKPCGGLTTSPGSRDNTFRYESFFNCIVSLDPGDDFENVVFRNSVIRYAGGAVKMINVRFENCSFQIDFPQNTKPAKPALLLALIGSPNQSSVSVP